MLWYYLIALNLAAFALMGVDKRKAVRGAWRVPERVLLGAALFGGALGGLLGMYAFRHKTNHGRFRYGLPLLTALWCGGLLWLFR